MEAMPIVTDAPAQAPLPAWAYPILNPILSFLVHSPFSCIMSSSIMILIFEGRKSGKRYSIVVANHEVDGKLYTFSSSNWSKNFIGGTHVGLRLRGKLMRATAKVVDDPVLIGRVIQRMAHERGEQLVVNMGLMGFGPDGTVRLQMPKGSRLVEFTLAR